jgi:signal transduction histidine kinase
VSRAEEVEPVGENTMAAGPATLPAGSWYADRQEERRRIARELHDRTAHAVRVALQDLELHEVYAGTDPAAAAAKLDSAKDALRETLDTIRRLCGELRAAVGPDGLEATLRRYLEAQVPPAVRVRLSVGGEVDLLPRAASEELYLALREAIRNAVQHSGLTELQVELAGGLAGSTAGVSARVRDNGAGFDPEAAAGSAGVGLRSMRERLEALGGTLAVASEPSSGTEVEFWLPWTDVPRQAQRQAQRQVP